MHMPKVLSQKGMCPPSEPPPLAGLLPSAAAVLGLPRPSLPVDNPGARRCMSVGPRGLFVNRRPEMSDPRWGSGERLVVFYLLFDEMSDNKLRGLFLLGGTRCLAGSGLGQMARWTMRFWAQNAIELVKRKYTTKCTPAV